MENGQGGVWMGQGVMGQGGRGKIGVVKNTETEFGRLQFGGGVENGTMSGMREGVMQGMNVATRQEEALRVAGAEGMRSGWQSMGSAVEFGRDDSVVKNTETDMNVGWFGDGEGEGVEKRGMGIPMGGERFVGDGARGERRIQAERFARGDGGMQAERFQGDEIVMPAGMGYGAAEEGQRGDFANTAFQGEVMRVADKRGRELVEGVKQLTGRAESPQDIMAQAMALRGVKSGMRGE